jgi:hypothetical protein
MPTYICRVLAVIHLHLIFTAGGAKLVGRVWEKYPRFVVQRSSWSKDADEIVCYVFV